MRIFPKIPTEEIDKEYFPRSDCGLDEEVLDLESALD